MAIGDKMKLLGQVSGAGAATITFSDIPCTESQSFVVRGVVSSASTATTTLRLRYNNVMNSFYHCHEMVSHVGAASTVQSYGLDHHINVVEIPGTGTNSGYGRSYFEIECFGLSNTSLSPGSPSTLARGGGRGGGATYSVNGWVAGSLSYTAGFGTSTDVTSIVFDLESWANFPTTTHMSIYQRPTSA